MAGLGSDRNTSRGQRIKVAIDRANRDAELLSEFRCRCSAAELQGEKESEQPICTHSASLADRRCQQIGPSCLYR